MRHPLYLLILVVFGSLLFASSGGPDDFGYRWVDSDEPGGPTFDWIEISSTGTAMGLYDDDGETITLSHSFEYYGIDYNQITICSNGWAALGATSSHSYWFTDFPDPDEPNSSLFILATDLYPPSSPGDIYYQDFGDYFVVEFDSICEISHYPDPAFKFEIIINYSRREIVYQYLDIEPLGSSYHTAYVGIENEAGTIGLLYGTWTITGGCLHDSLAIRFRATPIASPPYFDNFETESGDFTIGDSISGWERGPILATSPAFPPHSGGRCYGTVLNDDYDNNADWSLYTPHIDISTATYPIVDFWHYYQTEEGHDGGVVEISTDEGTSWNIIAPEDGYPTTMTAGPLSGHSAFSGSSDSWVYSSFDLSDYVGQEIMMRFRFASDGSNTDIGWYIDDFGYHQAFGVLQGNVDLAYYEPDSGATVEIIDLGVSTITDTAGDFFFDSVSVGNHYIKVSKIHFVTQDSIPFTINRFDTISMDIMLAPELYNDSFETGDGGLVAEPDMNGWEWGTPTVGPDNAHSGIKCWGTKLDGNYDNNADWSLILQVPLYEVNWPLLSFYTWYRFEAGFFGTFPDGGNVKVSTDSCATWEIVTPVGGYDGTIGDHNPFMPLEPAFGDQETGDFWHNVEVPLYDYSGNPVIWVKFELASDAAITSRGWYIDDIKISDDSTYAGIVENGKIPRELVLSATPNPFNSECRINYSIANDGVLEITDISGKIVHKQKLDARKNSVIWSADKLPSGLYFARINSGNRSRTIRISLVK